MKRQFERSAWKYQTKRQQRATEGTGYTVEPHDSRAFALYDRDGSLVAVFAYLKGAAAVAHRLAELERALEGIKGEKS